MLIAQNWYSTHHHITSLVSSGHQNLLILQNFIQDLINMSSNLFILILVIKKIGNSSHCHTLNLVFGGHLNLLILQNFIQRYN
jgi:hypothetical protein